MTTCILVIEDDLPSMTLVRYLLDSAGYRTIFAESGQDGAQKAVDASPDLILCDLQMPIWSGYDVVRHLKTLGFRYVTLDLEGFRSGSLNELIPLEIRLKHQLTGDKR